MRTWCVMTATADSDATGPDPTGPQGRAPGDRPDRPDDGAGRRGSGPREHRYTWTWDLASSPEQLWPLLADTDRFDRDTGVPAVHRRPEDDPADAVTTGRVAVSTRQYGVRLDYEQDPWEWEAPHWMRVRRRFRSGPLATLDVDIRLEPLDAGGTRLHYGVAARPRNALLGPAIPIQIGMIFARRFEATARRFDELARAGTPDVASGRRTRLSRRGRQRLADQASRTLADGADAAAVAHLAETVAHDDDTVVARLRPYALADTWGLDRHRVLDACLRATRSGMLAFRWDLLCPECRAAKASVPSLRELPQSVHCDTCNIDYGPGFARSVELTFRPTPAVREVDDAQHCIGSPMATPHVVAQALLAPGRSLDLGATLEPGRYRLRAPGLPGGRYLRVASAGAVARPAPADHPMPVVDDETLPSAETDASSAAATAVVVDLAADGWPDGEDALVPGERLVVTNRDEVERLVVLERTAWGDQAATAADVTARQEFRDLFADEALRPGDHVSVGTLTVLFTDLRDSTRLYQEVGDAVAFGRVLEHFDLLRDCVTAEGGAVVKTIGDAILAVFGEAGPAVRAARAAQEAVAGVDGLHLKAGIHTGPCIAVTLNDHLDYFGSTVNLAARLTPLSTGDDVVVSAAVHDDPEVRALLADGERWEVGELRSALKGFDGTATLYRLRPT